MRLVWREHPDIQKPYTLTDLQKALAQTTGSAEFAEEIFEYLSLPPEQFPVASSQFESPIMDRHYFERLTDRFRSPHLWRWSNEGWKLRNTVFGQ